MKTSLRQELHRVVQLAKEQQGVSLKSLLDTLGVHSPALLTLILSLPFLLPMPLPGLSTPFGVVIVLLGVSITFRRPPWLPKWLTGVKISEKILTQIIEKADPLLKRLEKFIKPRLTTLTTSKWGLSLHGVLIIFAAALLTLPAPPGGNLGPGISIILLSLGIIEQDGVMSLLGFVALVGTVVFFAEVIKLAASFIAFAHQASGLIG